MKRSFRIIDLEVILYREDYYSYVFHYLNDPSGPGDKTSRYWTKRVLSQKVKLQK